LLSELFWPEGGGAELATHLITDILSRVFEVTVVTGSRNPAVLPGVRYVYEPLLARREKAFLWLNIYRLTRTERFKKLVRGADIVYIPRLAFPAIPYVKEMGKTVVVHLHDYIPLSYSAAILAPYKDHKHRITRDDTILECRKGVKYCLGAGLLWWLPRLARKWISQADRIICVSRRQAKIITDRVPELRDKIEVVYNPLPPEITNVEPRKELDDTPTFLYVGGDSYVKGFYILLKAIKGLSKQGVKAQVILAGRYSSENLRLLNALRNRHQGLEICVIGRVSHEEIIKLHKKSWALITPSINEETFSYAAVEASMLGTIPIASNVGAIPELLGDTIASRYFFPPSDYVKLAQKIVEVSQLSTNNVVLLGETIKREIFKKLNPNAIEEKVIEAFISIKS
jgi:glycosyltransferase involved in cell wall biosynthesis